VNTAERGSVAVLVVDEEQSLRDSCASLLTNWGFLVTECERGDDALRLLRNRSFDIVLVNLTMRGTVGKDVLDTAMASDPAPLVIVMAGSPSVEASIAALRAGAWDYLPTPFSAAHLEVLVGRAAQSVLSGRARRRSEAAALAPGGSLSDQVSLFGRSGAIGRVVELATKVARTDASVFITGESGTGKEVIAQFIHAHSRRRDRPLVAVNCAAIPEALLESEMFGHVEGAFTGAVRDKEGLLEVANGGTLFLDELTELPLPTQAKLLRVLQDGVVRRVGSTKTDAVVDVRFITATNRSPNRAIEDGILRSDLHYRLRVVPIHIPPLRERQEDIPVMAEEFLKEFWGQHREPGSTRPAFAPETIEALRLSPWPGNVRELRNVVEHMVVLADPGQLLRCGDLVFPDESPSSPVSSGGLPLDALDMGYHAARERVLTDFEIHYLTEIVGTANGNISDAARKAGVDRTTLYRLMEKHGIGRDAGSRDPLGD
jgi:DNA-binding NtrC family response regulator